MQESIADFITKWGTKGAGECPIIVTADIAFKFRKKH